MAVFNSAKSLATVISPGDDIELLNGTNDAAGSTSIVITPGQAGFSIRAITFAVNFPSTVGSVTLYGSNTAPTSAGPQTGMTLATINALTGNYTDTNAYAFYWAASTATAKVEVMASAR